MREIKFRGKSELLGKWYVGDFITDINEFNRTCDKAYIASHWDTLNIPTRVIKETVGQFTGLKDKNGAEIFEGDIYHHGDKSIMYMVVHHDTSLIGKQLGSSSYAGLEHWRDKIEVVGNQVDNPELLEVKT